MVTAFILKILLQKSLTDPAQDHNISELKVKKKENHKTEAKVSRLLSTMAH